MKGAVKMIKYNIIILFNNFEKNILSYFNEKRSNKLRCIQQRIAEGAYHINSKELAKKMLTEFKATDSFGTLPVTPQEFKIPSFVLFFLALLLLWRSN
jgi:hypothetical protein